MKFSLKPLPQGHLARLLSLLLLVLTLGVYWQVVHFDFIAFDDPGYILGNNHVRNGLTKSGIIWAFTTIDVSRYWHPIAWLSHMLDVQLYGLNPAGHHVTNVIIHSVNALLLFLLLRDTTHSLGRSFLVAALFALHPLHIESVAWVAERKDVLCAFFWLLTLHSYVRYAKFPSKSSYLITLLCFAGGLMSKPMIVTLPFVLALFDYWPLGRFRRQGVSAEPVMEKRSETTPTYQEFALRHLFFEKIPFLILAAVSCIITYLAQNEGRAIQPWEAFSFKARVLNALHSYVQYIVKMFWPHDLAVFYPHPGTTLGIEDALAAALALGGLTVLAGIYLRRKPYLAVGWFWFLGTLVPVIGLVQVGAQGMADRYTYLPLIGLFLALVWGLADLLTKWQVRGVVKSVLAIAIISPLVSATGAQLSYWRNSTSLFHHALNVTERNFLAHYILSTLEEGTGNRDGDKGKHYREAVAIKPQFVSLMHNRRGYLLVKEGKLAEAVAEFETALRIRPDYLNARSNLGVAFAKSGKFAEAIEQLMAVLKRDPQNALVQNSLYNIYRDLAALRKAPHQTDARIDDKTP